jgi:hypothetical protein
MDIKLIMLYEVLRQGKRAGNTPEKQGTDGRTGSIPPIG